MKLKHAPAKKILKKVKKTAHYFINPSHSRPMNESLMDWSEDVPEVQSSPVSHVSPAGEHMPLPYVLSVRRSSHQGGSPQDVLGDERTCGTTLASAYVLRRLSAT